MFLIYIPIRTCKGQDRTVKSVSIKTTALCVIHQYESFHVLSTAFFLRNKRDSTDTLKAFCQYARFHDKAVHIVYERTCDNVYKEMYYELSHVDTRSGLKKKRRCSIGIYMAHRSISNRPHGASKFLLFCMSTNNDCR